MTWGGGGGGGIFSSSVAVLDRSRGGTIHNLRTEYSLLLPDPDCDSNLVGKKGRGKGEKERYDLLSIRQTVSCIL